MANGRMKLSQFLMTFTWVVYLFVYFFTRESGFMGMYDLKNFYYATLVFCAGMVALKIFICDKIPLKKLAITGVVLLVLVLSAIRSGDYSIVMIGVFAIGMRGIDFRELLKVDLVSKLVILCSIVGLSLIGVLENYVTVVDGHLKYSFGFYLPNMLGALLGAILIENLYLRFEKFSYLDYFLYFAAEVVCYFVSRTRSMILLLTVVLIFFVLIRRFHLMDLKHMGVKHGLMLTPVICLGFTLLVMMFYKQESGAWRTINQMMSGRMYYASYFWQQYGPSWVGQKISLVSSRTAGHDQALILDSCYAKLMIMFGLIPTAILMFALMRQIRNAIAVRDYQLLVIIIYFCLIGTFENYLIRPAYNMTLLLLLYYDNPMSRRRIRIKWRQS